MNGDVVIDGLPYPIIVADDAASALPPLVAPECSSVVVVFDGRISARAKVIAAALTAAGIEVRGLAPLTVDPLTKRSPTLASLYDALLESGAERATWLIAIGGGTVTDVAGFAAATFLRGIAWVTVPTTILGMADAAIGGKTAIDLPQGKNLVGAFWQPSAVVADLASLETLPAREWGTGLAEIIKCAIIGDPPLLDAVDGLAPGSGSKSWKDAVAAAARIKVRIVAEDPLEASVRAILNLGHTVGHALEAASGYALSHGAAVSVGIRAAGLLAQTQGWWPARDHARVLRSLKIAGLPLAAQGLAVDAVMAAVKRDKKNAGGGFRFVLPVRIGEVRYGIDVSEPTVRAAVAAVVEAPPASELGP